MFRSTFPHSGMFFQPPPFRPPPGQQPPAFGLVPPPGVGGPPFVQPLLVPQPEHLCTALILATGEGCTSCMKSIINKGVDMNMFADGFSETPLMSASRNGKKECLELLIRKGAHVNQCNMYDGYTALMYAAEEGNSECLRVLLECGADVNAVNSKGETAIYFAVCKGYVKCVEMLLQWGADVNIVNNLAKTAVAEATQSGFGECLKLILDAKVKLRDRDTNEALIEASKSGNESCVTSLIAVGADVNYSTYENTPLTAAAYEGHAAIVKILQHAGANVNKPTALGSTPLMAAAATDQIDVLPILREAGVDVNVVNWNGFTAVNIAAYNNAVACLKDLLRAGAFINIRDSYGQNALEGQLTGTAPKEEVSMLLFASGESLEDTSVEGIYDGKRKVFHESGNVKSLHEVPEYLQSADPKLCLKQMCRQAVRKHLLRLDPHRNLFGRIHQMALKSTLSEYLLYDMSLDAASHFSGSDDESDGQDKACNVDKDDDHHYYDYSNDHGDPYRYADYDWDEDDDSYEAIVRMANRSNEETPYWFH